jgi:hypothetical protein
VLLGQIVRVVDVRATSGRGATVVLQDQYGGRHGRRGAGGALGPHDNVDDRDRARLEPGRAKGARSRAVRGMDRDGPPPASRSTRRCLTSRGSASSDHTVKESKLAEHGIVPEVKTGSADRDVKVPSRVPYRWQLEARLLKTGYTFKEKSQAKDKIKKLGNTAFPTTTTAT